MGTRFNDRRGFLFQDFLVLKVEYFYISKQFRFASGSLAQYLHVQFSEKLQSSSTVDDVEGILTNFIPPGTQSFLIHSHFSKSD